MRNENDCKKAEAIRSPWNAEEGGSLECLCEYKDTDYILHTEHGFLKAFFSFRTVFLLIFSFLKQKLLIINRKLFGLCRCPEPRVRLSAEPGVALPDGLPRCPPDGRPGAPAPAAAGAERPGLSPGAAGTECPGPVSRRCALHGAHLCALSQSLTVTRSCQLSVHLLQPHYICAPPPNFLEWCLNRWINFKSPFEKKS